jgi:hypothetical protein
MGRRLVKQVLTGLAVGFAVLGSYAGETNVWPLYVEQVDSPVGRPDHAGSLGPIISRTQKGPVEIKSIRPFFTSFENLETGGKESYLLYPLFNWKDYPEYDTKGSQNLIKLRESDSTDEFYTQVFPFYFRNKTNDPETSYHAFWPFGGTLKDRFGRDEITFYAWPLFVRTQRDDETRIHTPYPFIQQLDGPKSNGFALWPFYGHFEREDDYEKTFALWPFYYNQYFNLDQEEPYQRLGVLPFYARETAPGLKSETFAWPFFGYTRENAPREEYWENRYFWPFFMQADGDKRTVNRWMPFYTHETSGRTDKKWYMWPILKRKTTREQGFIRDRTSVLYFLYRDEKQHYADGTAQMTTLWPIIGYWNNGAGRKQVQLLDPFTAFFPRNEKIRENWTPLFTLYRYDERMGNGRHSLLWDFVVWEKDATGTLGFFIGPLFQWEAGGEWSILKGLIGKTGEGDTKRMRFFWKK